MILPKIATTGGFNLSASFRTIATIDISHPSSCFAFSKRRLLRLCSATLPVVPNGRKMHEATRIRFVSRITNAPSAYSIIAVQRSLSPIAGQSLRRKLYRVVMVGKTDLPSTIKESMNENTSHCHALCVNRLERHQRPGPKWTLWFARAPFLRASAGRAGNRRYSGWIAWDNLPSIGELA